MTAPIVPITPTPRSAQASLQDHIAAALRARIAYAGVSQQQLARALKLSTSELSRRLSGKRPIKVDFIDNVCRALGIAPGELFQWAPAPTPIGAGRPGDQKPTDYRYATPIAA
jgi:transcriptional regulator with XRE-family HTH domain